MCIIYCDLSTNQYVEPPFKDLVMLQNLPIRDELGPCSEVQSYVVTMEDTLVSKETQVCMRVVTCIDPTEFQSMHSWWRNERLVVEQTEYSALKLITRHCQNSVSYV